MKQCPICDTSYPDEHTTCSTDGAVLIEIREWAPGTMVRGKYRILAKIGRGGMGIVYKATHIVFEEVWALKVMAAHLAADPKFVRRFRREAQVTRKLQHVNVVRVQDFDQAEDGSPFIVMDFIEGVSLDHLLQAVKGPLPVARALWIARGIAEGLSAAHGLGMVHRDIKPQNILLARDPQGRDVPKILDFGIVAMREGSTSLSAGLLLTAAYGSPEQWQGMKASELDGRADLYALGVSLYEMLAGRLPFHAHTDTGWMHAHLEETPAPPSLFNPELAQMPAVDELTLRLLAKDREARPNDALAFLNELNLLDAQLSWGQATIVSRRKDVDLMQTIQSRPTGDGGKGITTHPEAVKVPQAPERDLAAEKQKAEAEARAKAEAEAKAKAEAEAENAQRERQARSKKIVIGAVIGVVLLAVAIGSWLFLRTPSSPAALIELGLKYEKGQGEAEDAGKAAELYRQAAEKGDAAGEYHLARMYRDGQGTQQDPNQAAEWFTKSAQQNNSDAENELGMMYQKGSGKPQDDAQALNWYRKAAEQGNPVAEYNLGWMYNNGRGTTRDPTTAASWYRKAADQGNAVAQYTLGSMLQEGRGVTQNSTDAANLFRKAAEQNYGKAQLFLGQMYAAGQSVDQNPVEADMWLSLAAQDSNLSNDDSAFANSQKAELEGKMTPAQIAEAKRRVDDWKAHHPVSR
jgi:TPR repeat protein